MRPPRKRAQAIALGRGREQRLVVPLAFETAAAISARPLDAFLRDPTQLANGLAELARAIAADGAVVACADGMEREAEALDEAAMLAGARVAASLEACRRLRESAGDTLALVAGVTGPATLARQFDTTLAQADPVFAALTKAYCAAGADLVLVFEDEPCDTEPAWQAALRTAGNIARFHQASLLAWESTHLDTPVKQALDAPSPAGVGYVTTAARLPPDADIAALRAWVAAARGD